MVERGNALSRDPNVCASCSSLADGMEGADEAKVVGADVEAGQQAVIPFPMNKKAQGDEKCPEESAQ